MPRATKQTAPPSAVNGPAGGDVLTLTEAAAYLRLPEGDVIAAVTTQGLPARQVNNQWRFFKAAIQQWLSTPSPAPATGKAALLAMAGAWKDDPYLEDMVEQIYRQRGRPITEAGSYRLFEGRRPEGSRK